MDSSRTSRTSKRISIPTMRPRPRTSRMMRLFSRRRSSRPMSSAPTRSAFPTIPSPRMASRVAVPAAHDSGLPPNVDVCSPLPRLESISGLARVAPMGTPPAIPFARHMTSGATPSCSAAHMRPVRPRPDWISSNARTAPLSSHALRASRRNPSGAG